MTPKPDERSSLVDPRVADAWRDASSEEPAASLDAAILAAARREVSARPETLIAWEAREARASRRRWWPLAAAATVAAIAVGVLQLAPPDKVASPATETATVSDVPAPSAKPDAGAAAPPSAPPPPAAATKPAPRAKEAGALEPRQQAQPATLPTPDPFPAAKKTAADTAAAGGQVAASPPSPAPARPRAEAAANVARESDAAARPDPATAPAPTAPPPAAAPALAAPLGKMSGASSADSAINESRAKDRKPLPVADWIALIRRLRAEGKTDEAAKEIAAFRAAHPDHEKLLPPDLRDWRPPEK